MWHWRRCPLLTVGSSSSASRPLYAVKGANHFNLLSPVNRLIAARIVADKGPECKITFTAEEVNAAFEKERPRDESK